jgi:hypothetical protein
MLPDSRKLYFHDHRTKSSHLHSCMFMAHLLQGPSVQLNINKLICFMFLSHSCWNFCPNEIQSSVVVAQTTVFNTECLSMLTGENKRLQNIHTHIHMYPSRSSTWLLHPRTQGVAKLRPLSILLWSYLHAKKRYILRSYKKEHFSWTTFFVIIPYITTICSISTSTFASWSSYVPFSSWVILGILSSCYPVHRSAVSNLTDS